MCTIICHDHIFSAKINNKKYMKQQKFCQSVFCAKCLWYCNCYPARLMTFELPDMATNERTAVSLVAHSSLLYWMFLAKPQRTLKLVQSKRWKVKGYTIPNQIDHQHFVGSSRCFKTIISVTFQTHKIHPQPDAVVVGFFFACKDFGIMFNNSFPACAFFFLSQD